MDLSGSIRGHIGTSFVDATRPRWNSGSRRFVRHACGLTIHCLAGHCAAMSREGRVHVLLRREGWEINAKKTYRVYKELGMQLRNKTPKRLVTAKLREDRKEAVHPSDV